ncbi:MAG: hypothetical protein CSYNP_01686 [Syntrophus sp. SKADARSKE-3]|nr:hypothetical protein [Syntrophus sp. SKADARSKE-3]
MQTDRLKIVKILLLCGGLYLCFVTLFSRNLSDNDLWGYLSFGRVFWEDGYFPFYDIFAYTPIKSFWVYHEWLTGVIFYIICKYTGPAGLQLFRYILILFTIYLIYMVALKKGGNPLSAVIALIPAMALISFGYVPVRAQIFTYFFFILTVYILEDAKRTEKWSVLWWLVPIQILWCNLHGGFVAGIGLIGLYALGEALSRKKFLPYIMIGGIATLATLINPYGIKYWTYMIYAVGMPRPEIEEWMSVLNAIRKHYQTLPVYTFLALAFLSSILFAFRQKKSLTDFLVLVVTIYLGLVHVRHNALFAIIFGSFVPSMLSECWEKWKEKYFLRRYFSWIPQALPAAMFLAVYLLINSFLSLTVVPSFTLLAPSPYFPAGAVHWIKTNQIQGHILPHFDWGEFLIWKLYPDCRVAMDGRYESVYEDYVSQEYFDFLMGRDTWDIFLRKYHHDMVLIVPNTRTCWLMLKEPDWRVAYRDDGSVLFVRKSRS